MENQNKRKNAKMLHTALSVMALLICPLISMCFNDAAPIWIMMMVIIIIVNGVLVENEL